jgi:proline dehydrogenase
MYLKDSNTRLMYDNCFIKNNGINFGIKLVRGAYLKTETERFHHLGLKVHPNWDSIDKTHESYKNGVHFSLNNIFNNDYNSRFFFFYFNLKKR